MKKNCIIQYGNIMVTDICRHCGNTCEQNNLEFCTERKALEEMVAFIKKYMNEEGTGIITEENENNS